MLSQLSRGASNLSLEYGACFGNRKLGWKAPTYLQKSVGDDYVRCWWPWHSCGIRSIVLPTFYLDFTQYNPQLEIHLPTAFDGGGLVKPVLCKVSIWSWRTKENGENEEMTQNHEDYSLLPTTYKILGKIVKTYGPVLSTVEEPFGLSYYLKVY